MAAQNQALQEIYRMGRVTGKLPSVAGRVGATAGADLRKNQGMMTDQDYKRRQQMMPRPSLGDRIKRMTEWFTTRFRS